MTSKKSKQERLDESRLKTAAALSSIDTRDSSIPPPSGAVMADQAELSHNNTYDRLPLYYVDKVLTCRDCGKRELWTAEQQKWWYETAKGNINATAVHCRACRDKRKAVRDAARKASEAGLLKKQKKHEAQLIQPILMLRLDRGIHILTVLRLDRGMTDALIDAGP